MTRAHSWWLLAALLLSRPAFAAPTPDEMREARSRYERGMAKYVVRDFDGAIVDFKIAYELTSEPGLLFNLGQACRLGKRPEDALYFYRTYLRQFPDAPNRRDVVEFIERLAALPPPEAAVLAPLPVLAPPTAIAPRPPSRRVELGLGIAFSGAALALGGGGVGLGIEADNDARHVSASAAKGVAWNPALRSEWNEGQRDAQAATALYVVGGACAITGVVLSALGARHHWAGHLAAAPTAGGAQVAWSGSF